ncbi:MAG: DUF4115 domain-containing protein [Ignavibacteria bacterium]|nr:DUF4115 domain-containing protein [Ignavibacteria bacterium]
MNKDALLKFAEELKNSRTEKKITLEQISAKTRIDIKFLKAIESGEIEILPEIYIKAFIKEYAKTIDLNPENVLKKFELAKSGLSDEPVAEENSEKPETKKTFENPPENIPKSEMKEKTNKSNIALLIGAALFVILLIIIFTFFSGNNKEIITENSTVPEEEIKKEITVDKNTEVKKEQPAIPEGVLKLRISASDTSWVKIISDESVAEEITLYPGMDKYTAAGSSFHLIIGNSAGINLELNYNKLEFSGNENQVKSVFINSEGLKYIKTKDVPGYDEQGTN